MKTLTGRRKWGLLLGSILVLELLPGPTLSAAHREATKRPAVKWPVLVMHAYIIAHLWGAFPEKYDPLCNMAIIVDRIKKN